MVDKMYQPWESRQTCVEYFTPARILNAARALPVESPDIEELIRNLKEEHIIVDVAAIHYGMGEKFPLENCMFYGKYEPNSMSFLFFFKKIFFPICDLCQRRTHPDGPIYRTFYQTISESS